MVLVTPITTVPRQTGTVIAGLRPAGGSAPGTAWCEDGTTGWPQLPQK